jgi:PEP-CTERM motif-containing protein
VQFRHIAAAAAAAIAITAAGSASATVTQLTFTGAGDSGQIYFNGLVPGTSTIDTNLSSTFVLTLASVTNGGHTWNFNYQLTNSSALDSRLAVVGWDVGPDFASASDVSGLFTSTGSGNMSFGGAKEFCLKSAGGVNCSGGGGGGLLDGASGSGAFALNFTSEIVGGTKKDPIYTPVPAPSSLVFNNFGVHYQSVPGYESTVGVPSAPPPPPEVTVGVPEPETWAMMILGFFGMGLVVRRRRQVARAA